MSDQRLTAPVLKLHPVFQFALLFTFLFILHAPLLRLPYFWDEAGYYIPAAYDIYTTGDPIPHSTMSNAHPPLVMAYLAGWWKLSGYKPAVTRTAMLLWAALALLGLYRLGRNVTNRRIAVAAVLAAALYPVVFAQSSMALVDLPAAGLSLWGLAYYVEDRRFPSIAAFCLAVLAKELAIMVPLSIAAWEILWWIVRRFRPAQRSWSPPPRALGRSLLLLIPTAPLAAWFGFHYARTGYIFGNPEFVRYNVTSTLHAARIGFAAVHHAWQLVGYMHLFVLTVAAASAMIFPPIVESGSGAESASRPRIDLSTQTVFAVIILAHLAVLSIIGGAELARYMLLPLMLVILLCVSTVWRRVVGWWLVIVLVCAAFVIGLFVNPPVPFAIEDNLTYRDYVLLHKGAADYLARHYASARVLTAWPASDELTKPYLGYVQRPIPVARIDDFSATQLLLATHAAGEFDVAYLFSTEYEPPRDLLARFPAWQRTQQRWFGYHRDVPPAVAAQMLGGRIVQQHARDGEWTAIVDMQHSQMALQYRGTQ